MLASARWTRRLCEPAAQKGACQAQRSSTAATSTLARAAQPRRTLQSRLATRALAALPLRHGLLAHCAKAEGAVARRRKRAQCCCSKGIPPTRRAGNRQPWKSWQRELLWHRLQLGSGGTYVSFWCPCVLPCCAVRRMQGQSRPRARDSGKQPDAVAGQLVIFFFLYTTD